MWLPFGFVVAALLSGASGNPGSQPLADYLERAGLTWLALPDCGAERARCAAFEAQEGEGEGAVADRVRVVAGDLAELLTTGLPVPKPEGSAYRNDEPSPYADDPTKARAGLLVMSLAFHESRFRGYVAHCTDKAWRSSLEGKRLLRFGSCDSGRASTLWQMHLGTGVVLGWEPGREWREVNIRAPFVGMRDDEIAYTDGWVQEDDFIAAAVALHMARASIRQTGSLRNYTGEWSGPASAARAREDRALAYYRAHPFPGMLAAEETTR